MITDKIAPQRLVTYLILFGAMPLLAVLLYLASANSALSDLENALTNVQETAFLLEKRQAQNNAVYHHYSAADHFYLDKSVEPLVFLKPEIDSLQKLAANKNIGQTETLTKRLELLTGPGNKLQFVEGVVQAYPTFQETLETLAHTVEVDIDDIQEILAVIEGVDIGPYHPGPDRPQLVITEFKIDKKKIRENNEVFTLNLKLLKREFL